MTVPNPNCPECDGSGMVRLPDDAARHRPPAFNRCSCVLREDIRANAARIVPGILAARPIKSSLLLDKIDRSLRVTATEASMMSHLRHVAIRQPPTWVARVASDADLITAWLASVAVKGAEIFDADAFEASITHLTVLDLVSPPHLLIVRMGVKAARNSACAEVMVEAINLRLHEKKPTWVWDQPDNPLASGHLFWSDEVGRTLSRFDRVTLASVAVEPTGRLPSLSSILNDGKTAGSERKSLRGPKK